VEKSHEPKAKDDQLYDAKQVLVEESTKIENSIKEK